MKTSTPTITAAPYHADFVDFIEGKLKEFFGVISNSPKLQAEGAMQPVMGDVPHAVSKHPKAKARRRQ